MRFAKAHAYGNDFLYVDGRGRRPGATLDALAREMCDRHTGIGADGLIVYEPTADGVAMRLFNADGSRAEVSGNGVRGAGRAAAARRRPRTRRVTIRTEAGAKRLTRTGRDGSRQTFRTAMGPPRDVRQVAARGRPASRSTRSCSNIGNPQCVAPRPAAGRRAVSAGSAPRSNGTRCFPSGTNVEFADVEAPDRVRIRIWERGVRSDLVVGHRIVRRRWSRRRRSAAPRATRTSSRPAGRSGSSGATTASISPAGRKCSAKASGSGRLPRTS